MRLGCPQQFYLCTIPWQCAVTQHQCTAALLRAKRSPHCSVLVCKSGSQQAVCQCKYTHEVLLFKQVCSEPTPKHCSTGQCRIASLLFSAALHNRLTASLCHCSYIYEDLLYIQVCSDLAPLLCSGQNAVAIVQCCRQCHCKYTYADWLFMHVCSDATPMHCSSV